MKTDKHLRSLDVKTDYESGKRIFENAEINYAEMEGWNLDGAVFRNCRFNFASFRQSSLRGSRFINCEFFFGSFFSTNLDSALFENTRFEIMRFDNAIFNNTIFKNCNISYASMMSTNINGADFQNTERFRVFTDISQVTQADLEAVARILFPALESLDLEIRNHIKAVMEKATKEAGIRNPITEGSGRGRDGYGNTPVAGNAYEKLSDILNEAISLYGQKHPYKTKPSYKAEGKYK